MSHAGIEKITKIKRNMIIVTVKFTLSAEISPNTLREKFRETAPINKETQGLIKKTYI